MSVACGVTKCLDQVGGLFLISGACCSVRICHTSCCSRCPQTRNRLAINPESILGPILDVLLGCSSHRINPTGPGCCWFVLGVGLSQNRGCHFGWWEKHENRWPPKEPRLARTVQAELESVQRKAGMEAISYTTWDDTFGLGSKGMDAVGWDPQRPGHNC